MEELHRTHKEVPFGWVLAARALWRAVNERRVARTGIPAH